MLPWGWRLLLAAAASLPIQVLQLALRLQLVGLALTRDIYLLATTHWGKLWLPVSSLHSPACHGTFLWWLTRAIAFIDWAFYCGKGECAPLSVLLLLYTVSQAAMVKIWGERGPVGKGVWEVISAVSPCRHVWLIVSVGLFFGGGVVCCVMRAEPVQVPVVLLSGSITSAAAVVLSVSLSA